MSGRTRPNAACESQAVRRLLALSVDPSAVGRTGCTHLILAAHKGRADIVQSCFCKLVLRWKPQTVEVERRFTWLHGLVMSLQS